MFLQRRDVALAGLAEKPKPTRLSKMDATSTNVENPAVIEPPCLMDEK
jgi:hypothetical protein